MILLDLEKALYEFNEYCKASGIYLPGALICHNTNIFKHDIDISNSIFNLLILNSKNLSLVTTYSKINPKEYFNMYLYDTDYYVPDSNGRNILNLSSDDIQYLNDINNDIPPTITPTSDFLLSHYDINYNPTTYLGKIIKFVKMVYEYLDAIQNPVTID